MSATAAGDRYGVQPAPGDLHLSHELINTVAVPGFAPPDLLGTPDAARAWLEPVLEAWTQRHGGVVPELQFTAADLRRLRTLRTSLRALVSGTGPGIDAPVTVHAGPDAVRAVPSGRGVAWIESAVAAELLTAADHHELRRLKLCRNEACELGFYDRSKNNSRIWHDLAHCGTPMHVREYRKRLRAAASGAQA